jgi:hypothetical protein
LQRKDIRFSQPTVDLDILYIENYSEEEVKLFNVLYGVEEHK